MSAMDWIVGMATFVGFAMGLWVGWKNGYGRGYRQAADDLGHFVSRMSVE